MTGLLAIQPEIFKTNNNLENMVNDWELWLKYEQLRVLRTTD